jgi:hypothetical protein
MHCGSAAQNCFLCWQQAKYKLQQLHMLTADCAAASAVPECCVVDRPPAQLNRLVNRQVPAAARAEAAAQRSIGAGKTNTHKRKMHCLQMLFTNSIQLQ